MKYKSLLACTANTRELGGLRTADGGITRNCVFWRSDVPVNPSTEDIKKLLANRITTIIDMRTDAEIQRVPDLLSETDGFEYHHFDITEGSGVPETLEAVPHSYMDIALAKNMPDVMKTIAESENGVLFHCSAGKDRTGVTAAIILMLCYVEREVIVNDYVLSREYNKEKLEAFLGAHPEIDRDICLANEKSMNGFIDLFTQRFGNADNYFEYIGLTAEHAAMIRNRLVMR